LEHLHDNEGGGKQQQQHQHWLGLTGIKLPAPASSRFRHLRLSELHKILPEPRLDQSAFYS
jgi:hypothetical protein